MLKLSLNIVCYCAKKNIKIQIAQKKKILTFNIGDLHFLQIPEQFDAIFLKLHLDLLGPTQNHFYHINKKLIATNSYICNLMARSTARL